MKKSGSGSEYNGCLLNQEQDCNSFKTPWNTLEHSPDGPEPPGLPLITKIRQKSYKTKTLKYIQWINKYVLPVTGKRRLGQIDEFTLFMGFFQLHLRPDSKFNTLSLTIQLEHVYVDAFC